VPDRAFDDHVVSTVANCFQGPQTDEGVQLQVLKGLLTIVTSNHIRVHENSLLLAIRTCYNIYLASRNLINQTTAKATLNQMLNCVFSCMESESLEEVIETKRQQEAAVAAVMNQAAAQQTQQQSSAVQQNGNGTASGEEQESSLYEIVYPIVDDLVSNLNLLSPSDENFKNLLQKDAFLVFRSLCKLSMKALPDGNPDPKSHELRSKILSLQLLLSILQNGGPAFQTNEIFVSAIKSYLCVALSQNGVSPIGEVFELSLAIFLSLLTKYRRHLKSQIEIFFKEICLNILEASSSSFEQKWVVVQGITSVCSEAQIVIDIYVNYDCDLAAANVFERLVDDLSKLAQGRHAFEIGSSQNQLMKIRVKGLDCLCTILKCMVEWSKDLYVNPHASKKSASDLNSSISVSEHDFVDSSLEPRTASDDPSQFEKVKQHKHILEHGLKLFSQKPRKGIKYFQEQGIIKNGGLAEFLTNENDRLDKGALGEYLGELENKEIMYHYIDQMNLVGLGFVSSLRFLLEGFRLPGEAQKIDRLMEKFASRYVECNPNQNIFKSADGAYVLAYSVIMLTTDLHSAHVKKKMTSEEFVKNNRGINDDEDLPKEYLSKIYEEIADNEIKVKPTGSNVGKRSLTQDQKTRNLIWSQESNTISQTAGALMESASSKKDVFTSARHLDHVKPMFKQIWSPLLATFSVGLQDSDDPAIAQLCIEGIRCAIRIANIFGFSMERNAFIQALARFTLLTDNSNVSEMKAKNIEAIKTLISVANSDGNYLETSWLEIMKSVSQLEFAQMLDNSQRPQQDPPASEAESNYRSSLSEANSQSVLVAVDRIFNGSKNLNGDAIVHFVAALCQVSCDEISHANPRMFSLVKVVEISYYNMERIRLEWSRIWQVLGNHFNLVGCNHSQVGGIGRISQDKFHLYHFFYSRIFPSLPSTR
jgi:brefeldin A-inhibited guanine nucleotide-exchange protein